jgi:hypothetical protein
VEYINNYIVNINEFENLKSLLDRIVIPSCSLPNKVFQETYNNYLFREFDFAMTESFWVEIRELANKINDDSIIMAVLSPDPLNYYYKEFGYFNWVKLKVSITPAQYMDILNLNPKDSPADSIFINSNTIVWASSSKKWAIWGEREKGVCVIAFNEKLGVDIQNLTSNNWRSIDNTVTDWIGLNYKNYIIPKDIENKLFVNYKNS